MNTLYTLVVMSTLSISPVPHFKTTPHLSYDTCQLMASQVHQQDDADVSFDGKCVPDGQEQVLIDHVNAVAAQLPDPLHTREAMAPEQEYQLNVTISLAGQTKQLNALHRNLAECQADKAKSEAMVAGIPGATITDECVAMQQ